jgi:uncharacterized protein (TIGR03437 family)
MPRLSAYQGLGKSNGNHQQSTAQVLFAGLAPGFGSLYQANVIVPSVIAAGRNVPLILTAAGLASPTVTVPIE